MRRHNRSGANKLALCAIVLLSHQSFGQARVVSAPSEPSLLNLTSGWARASTLGDLRDLRVGSDYLELRVWHGYSAAETQATVLRRTEGHWSASFARVIRCELQVPRSAADTASSATMRRFVAEARRNCGVSVVDVAPGARLIAADTLVVQPLEISEADIAAVWQDAQTAGVTGLPARVQHTSAAANGGSTYVIELRRGNEYRASEIEDVERPEVKADSQVKQIYDALKRLRP